MPVDFCYIGPTELELMDQLQDECEVLAVFTGSILSKQAFLNTPRYILLHLLYLPCSRSEGGAKGSNITLVEDRGGHIANAFGVLRDGTGTGLFGSGYR